MGGYGRIGVYRVKSAYIVIYQRDSSETLHRNSRMSRLVHRRSLHLLQFAFKLKIKDDLLDLREIPTRRRVGIVLSLVIIINFL